MAILMRRKINYKELLSNNRKEIENDFSVLEKIEIKVENKHLNKTASLRKK